MTGIGLLMIAGGIALVVMEAEAGEMFEMVMEIITGRRGA